MKTATVIGSGRAQHPESGANLTRVTVALPYAQGGQTCGSTDVWGPGDMPEPTFGETLKWDHRYIWFRDVRYDKPEDDDPTYSSTFRP